MRWEQQRLGRDESQPALPGMPGWVRSVRTPEFAGVVFHEVAAKSVLNRIPGQSPMPFDWTVNPYRGCGHACRYCLAGDTPILMADGRSKPLAELTVGERIYGTVRQGRERRLTVTRVLDRWTTTKPAYRVTLDDGTRLVTSGDHRLLTDLGWRFVAAGSGGRVRRPQLRIGTRLVGTGGFAAPPKDTTDYRLGYLCGVVRCGARPGPSDHSSGARRRLLLASVEYEALARARAYLLAAGVATDRFLDRSQPPQRNAQQRPHRHEVLAIGAASGGDIEQVARLVRWPTNPSDDWRRGLLAGCSDACGGQAGGRAGERAAEGVGERAGEHHASEIIIESGDPEIVANAFAALQHLGFDAAMEGTNRVRLLGGLAERLRFVHSVDPAIGRKRTLDGAALGAEDTLAVRSVEPLGIELPLVDITTGTGDFVADGVVSHNCFARNSHTYLDLDAGADFDSQLVVKVNTPEVLARELRSPRWAREPVAMGTNTDPYQRAEGRYRLMPGVIEAFVATGTPFSVLTKGTLLARDLPLLVDASARVRVGLGVSIAMIDRRLSASVEPGTPSPQARLELVRRITDAGLRCGVMVAPVLPCLTDDVEALDTLLGEIKAAGATGATVLALHLRPGAREWYRAWLASEHPDLVPRYDEIYRGGSYANRRYRAWLARRVGPLVRKHGLHRRAGTRTGQPGQDAGQHGQDAGQHGQPGRVPLPAAEQLTLL